MVQQLQYLLDVTTPVPPQGVITYSGILILTVHSSAPINDCSKPGRLHLAAKTPGFLLI